MRKKIHKIAKLTDLEVGSNLLKVIDLGHILSDPVKVTKCILAPLFKVICFCDELFEILMSLVQLFEAAVDLVWGLNKQETYAGNFADIFFVRKHTENV